MSKIVLEGMSDQKVSRSNSSKNYVLELAAPSFQKQKNLPLAGFFIS